MTLYCRLLYLDDLLRIRPKTDRFCGVLGRLLSKPGKGPARRSTRAQFTSEVFTGLLQEQDIQVSMDSKGRYQDTIFVERL